MTNQTSNQTRTLREVADGFKLLKTTYGSSKFSFLVANEAAPKVAVMMHGVTGNKLDMAAMAEAAVKLGYAVYMPDLPGHGDAPELFVTEFDQLGRWFNECVLSIGRIPEVVMGHSYGSAICYNYAQQGFLPESTRLVMGCPTPTIAWSTRILGPITGMFPGPIITRLYNTKLAIDVRVNYLSQVNSLQSRQWMFESEYHKVPFIDMRIGNYLGMLIQTDNPFRGPRISEDIQKRTTVVLGLKDNVVTPKAAGYLRSILPHARFGELTNAGHILHFEAPIEAVSYLDHKCVDVNMRSVVVK